MDTYNRHYDINFEEDVKRGMVGENAHHAFLSGTHEVKTDYPLSAYDTYYILHSLHPLSFLGALKQAQ